jgi:hypothetical protein
MIYMVDIDGTICSSTNGEYKLAKPYSVRIDYVNKLYDDGHTIIYWTARGSNTKLDWSELTKYQLDSWGCKYHELHLKKPMYDVWVDDKAINDKSFFPL